MPYAPSGGNRKRERERILFTMPLTNTVRALPNIPDNVGD
jgi:hypothetical protein